MIRQFRSQDAQSCSNLIHSCLEADPSISPSLRQKLLKSESPQMMEERARSFYVVVYELDSKITGVAGLELNEIRLMCVSPECQRTGIGRALIEHIAAMAPAFLFKDLFVYSSMPAVEFYKSQGFIEKGPVSFKIGGELMQTIFMIRPTIPCPL